MCSQLQTESAWDKVRCKVKESRIWRKSLSFSSSFEEGNREGGRTAQCTAPFLLSSTNKLTLYITTHSEICVDAFQSQPLHSWHSVVFKTRFFQMDFGTLFTFLVPASLISYECDHRKYENSKRGISKVEVRRVSEVLVPVV